MQLNVFAFNVMEYACAFFTFQSKGSEKSSYLERNVSKTQSEDKLQSVLVALNIVVALYVSAASLS